MEGEIIIRAMTLEKIREAAEAEGKEFNTGISFDVRLAHATLAQRLTIVKGLGDALRFTKLDWALLMMLVSDPETFDSGSLRIQVPHPEELRRKEGED